MHLWENGGEMGNKKKYDGSMAWVTKRRDSR
jgi:hypothetical protein